MTAKFERLIREAARPNEPPTVWWVVALLVRARTLRGEEQILAVVAIANALVRRNRLLDMAAELLESVAHKPRHIVLTAQADLAQQRGDIERAKALRLLAGVAPDAPTESDALAREWASQEVRWRKSDSSKRGKTARLDALFRAHRAAKARPPK